MQKKKLSYSNKAAEFYPSADSHDHINTFFQQQNQEDFDLSLISRISTESSAPTSFQGISNRSTDMMSCLSQTPQKGPSDLLEENLDSREEQKVNDQETYLYRNYHKEYLPKWNTHNWKHYTQEWHSFIRRATENYAKSALPKFTTTKFLALEFRDTELSELYKDNKTPKSYQSGFEKEILLRDHIRAQTSLKELPRFLLSRANATFHELDGVFIGTKIKLNQMNFVLAYPKHYVSVPTFQFDEKTLVLIEVKSHCFQEKFTVPPPPSRSLESLDDEEMLKEKQEQLKYQQKLKPVESCRVKNILIDLFKKVNFFQQFYEDVENQKLGLLVFLLFNGADQVQLKEDIDIFFAENQHFAEYKEKFHAIWFQGNKQQFHTGVVEEENDKLKAQLNAAIKLLRQMNPDFDQDLFLEEAAEI